MQWWYIHEWLEGKAYRIPEPLRCGARQSSNRNKGEHLLLIWVIALQDCKYSVLESGIHFLAIKGVLNS